MKIQILWLDCDREGENICFEVINSTKFGVQMSDESKFLTFQSVGKDPRSSRILRAKFSAITESDIKRAMDNLVLPNENEAKAVDAR